MNETRALALVAQGTTDGSTRLQFKNISARNVNGFVLELSDRSQLEVDTSTGDRVLAPGEVQDLEIPGEVPTITVLAVMYADGSLEGDPNTVAELRNRRSALKAELKRVLELIVVEAQSRDANTPGEFDRLESAISKLQTADENIHQSNALHVAKGDVGGALDVMRQRQQHNAHLNQRELLQELRGRIERRIAGL